MGNYRTVFMFLYYWGRTKENKGSPQQKNSQ